MFWRMAGLSTASPVETILDKSNFSLEELLDEDEIIQECKALNTRLINFLRERPQVEQLIHFIVEEAPEDAERQRTFKFPFISCEIFTCEVDIILKTLVEDDELMKKLFSFLEPGHSHSALLAGYFSKVVICLLMRKTVSLMNYIQAHKEIIQQLVDLIGITSIMEVLIRLIGADEHIYSNYTEAMQWLQDTDVLEMIVDKFSSSDSPEVHVNAAETLCAITRYAPPGIAAKICSPSLIGRLFHNALEESRPKSALVNSLSVCISLLDPTRSTFGSYYSYSRQFSQGPSVTANSETVEGMLGSIGNLLKLLEVSGEESVLLTTYGKLQPPLGKQRLKIVEFISVLISIFNEAAEKEVIRLGAVQRILDMFFEYPYNNFLHHHVEVIIKSCLENKKSTLVRHLLRDCNLVGRILEAEKHPLLSTDTSKPTVSIDETPSARIGNIGHLTRISNKLVHLATANTEIQGLLQENAEWLDWCANVLSKRNAVENVHQWVCGRPSPLQDRARDSDDDDYQDRDYDVAALANNLSQAFHYGIYSNDIDEVQGSHERDEEDRVFNLVLLLNTTKHMINRTQCSSWVIRKQPLCDINTRDVYFDEESAEVVISSLRLGEDQESGSLLANSNWLAFEKDGASNESSTGSITSPSSGDEPVSVSNINDDLVDTSGSSQNTEPDPKTESQTPDSTSDSSLPASRVAEQTEWVEWRETCSLGDEQGAVGPAVTGGVQESTSQDEESCPSVATHDVEGPESSVDSDGDENVGESLSCSSEDDLKPSVDVEPNLEPGEGEKICVGN